MWNLFSAFYVALLKATLLKRCKSPNFTITFTCSNSHFKQIASRWCLLLNLLISISEKRVNKLKSWTFFKKITIFYWNPMIGIGTANPTVWQSVSVSLMVSHFVLQLIAKLKSVPILRLSFSVFFFFSTDNSNISVMVQRCWNKLWNK